MILYSVLKQLMFFCKQIKKQYHIDIYAAYISSIHINLILPFHTYAVLPRICYCV